jgi:hypothetical protein
MKDEGAPERGARPIIDVWESREAHQAWFDDHIAPNLPPGMEPRWEYIDLVLAVPAR